MDWTQALPPLWQWVGIGLGIAAFVVSVVAVSSVFQMWWGGPRVTVKLRDRDPFLECVIINEPIHSRILRFFHVRRESVKSLRPFSVRITEGGTGKFVAEWIPKIATLYTNEPLVDIKSLPPAVIVGFPITAVVNNNVVLVNDKVGVLPLGDYIVTVSVYTDGMTIDAKRSFAVRDKSPFHYWQ